MCDILSLYLIVMIRHCAIAMAIMSDKSTLGGSMRYKKCPRCELNYITNNEEYCDICQRELQGKALDLEFDYCYICGRELDFDDIDICKVCKSLDL